MEAKFKLKFALKTPEDMFLGARGYLIPNRLTIVCPRAVVAVSWPISKAGLGS